MLVSPPRIPCQALPGTWEPCLPRWLPAAVGGTGAGRCCGARLLPTDMLHPPPVQGPGQRRQGRAGTRRRRGGPGPTCGRRGPGGSGSRAPPRRRGHPAAPTARGSEPRTAGRASPQRPNPDHASHENALLHPGVPAAARRAGRPLHGAREPGSRWAGEGVPGGAHLLQG